MAGAMVGTGAGAFGTGAREMAKPVAALFMMEELAGVEGDEVCGLEVALPLTNHKQINIIKNHDDNLLKKNESAKLMYVIKRTYARRVRTLSLIMALNTTF